MYNNINPAPGGGAENWREREREFGFHIVCWATVTSDSNGDQTIYRLAGTVWKEMEVYDQKGQDKRTTLCEKRIKECAYVYDAPSEREKVKEKKREFEWWWIERVIQPIGRAACDRDEDGPTNQCCNCAYNVFWYIPHLVSCCRGTSASITFFKCNAYTYGIRANGTMTGTNRPLVLTRHFSQLSALLLLLLLSPFRSWRWADPLAHYQRIGWRNDSPGN